VQRRAGGADDTAAQHHQKEVRNYPEQPPVIPHTTQGYQIDINGNKCLSCHAGTCTAPHWLAGDAVVVAPVSGQIPC
jgi:nitrate reductase cytochrome c-type subunit